jgi:hypothetical protein
MMGDGITHRSWNSKLPIVKAKVHDRFRVSTYDATAPIGGETIEHRKTHVFVPGRAVGVRNSSETPIAQILFVDGGSFAFDAFRKQLE